MSLKAAQGRESFNASARRFPADAISSAMQWAAGKNPLRQWKYTPAVEIPRTSADRSTPQSFMAASTSAGLFETLING